MAYYVARTLDTDEIAEAEERITAALSDEGFGVLSRIDVAETLKKKLDADFRPYLILGACNPEFAHKALQAEDKIGTMLPCNVIVQKTDNGVEIAAIDPVESMQAVGNDALSSIAASVRDRLRRAVEAA
ncbi:hypothetical protein GCM10011367_18780 [Marinicauda pacifica]|uniref:DUF302 domain-containing protein n=1 Tax=Marinicauda pacifica TaxID=1133559 RepID=A0A4S2HCS7_9PROT|nr:DUF302 domain-containing protein [Marinicauda pacifica]TGY93272.1 DUF302 domain-containing protein [Marinicauda pacifica]GGE44290.1 hypothetical protein GCM10011367_18780 [Marinicauda pacifica]